MSVEYGDSDSKSPFPASWGRPPAGAYSEERARWVKARVREEMRGSSMRTLRMRQLQMLVHLRQRLYEGEVQDG
jgi:hypothetical protein